MLTESGAPRESRFTVSGNGFPRIAQTRIVDDQRKAPIHPSNRRLAYEMTDPHSPAKSRCIFDIETSGCCESLGVEAFRLRVIRTMPRVLIDAPLKRETRLAHSGCVGVSPVDCLFGYLD